MRIEEPGFRFGRWMWRATGIPLAVVFLVIGAAALLTGRASPASPAASPPLTSPADLGLENAASGAAVDGLPCESTEQLTVHFHAHLALFVNGAPVAVPAGIGIPGGGGCIYWLHTHAADGIIHIEAPSPRSFALGELFDVWGQSLDRSHVGRFSGGVTVFVNGVEYQGDPRQVPLTAHAVIQVDLGSVVPPQPFGFPAGD